MDRQLIVDLLDAPAQLWPKLIRRHDVLAPLASTAKLTIADADEGARLLGISRRRFYSQLAAFQARSRGRAGYSYLTGRNRILSAEQDQAIQDAYKAAGDHGRLQDICAEMRRLCARRRIPAPSITSVNTRLGRTASAVNLAACFGLDCPFVPDLSGLKLRVHDGQVEGPARLLALFCTATSRVIWHKIFLGLPSKPELTAEIQGAIAAALMKMDTEWRPDPSSREPWRAKSLRSSAVARRAFGPTIGRIRLAFPERLTEHDCKSSAPLEIARAVIAEMIERRNVALSDALFAQSHL